MRQSIRALEKRRLVHLSSHCDAVEELIRYAQASQDHKLQPHPAYLEARRVLQMHAERLSGQSLVALAGQNCAPSPSAEAPQPSPSRPPAPAVVPDNKVADTDNVPGEPARPLPPMRMARIW